MKGGMSETDKGEVDWSMHSISQNVSVISSEVEIFCKNPWSNAVDLKLAPSP